MTDAIWARAYRPDPRTPHDPRSTSLSGGYITSDPDDLAHFAAVSLERRGNVVLQRCRFLDDLFSDSYTTDSYDADRRREAERAEARP
jgi:hypothetical protein